MPDSAPREWVAAVPFSSGSSFLGRLSLWGGTLVLADDVLIFKPLGRIGPRQHIWLKHIESVGPDGDKPPRLRVSVVGSEPLVFIALTRRWASMFSTDTSARDVAVEAIRAAAAVALHEASGRRAGCNP
jgi:hypothetical protein